MQPPQLPEETSFLSPVPRERHSESMTPSRRPDGQRPSRIIKLPPVAPERKQSPDRKPMPDRKQLPDKKPQPRRNDCKTQLKLVDKDVTTGRSYIKALDKRFRILKRNLQRALNECQGRRLEEASFKKQLPEAEPIDELQSSELQVVEIQGSELAVRPPEAAIYEIEESNLESVLDSIQGILPTIVEANAAARDYSIPDELQPACSFRYYNRGQRYGRRYGDYDSDFDSYNGYYRRHRGYGRRHYNNRRHYGYSDAYDDPYYDRYYDDYDGDSDLDYEYRRSPYGRRRGYDSYRDRRRYGRSRSRWLSSNKMGKVHNKKIKGRPRFRVKRHKYDAYEDDFSDDFESASDEDYSKSSGFDSFSDRSYSGQSESISRSDEARGRSREHNDRHQRRGRDADDRRRQETDHYEGRENRRYEDRHREGKKSCSDCPRRKYHKVSYRKLYNYPRSRCRYGSRSRYRDYYSEDSSFDTDMDYGQCSSYGRSRYRRHSRYGLYGRGRRYGRYGGMYRSRRSTRYGSRRYDRDYASDSDYDSDTDCSSSDGRYRRYGGRRYYMPRYYVSTKCRPKCEPKAIEQPQPEKKIDQSTKSPGNAPQTKIEAITC